VWIEVYAFPRVCAELRTIGIRRCGIRRGREEELRPVFQLEPRRQLLWFLFHGRLGRRRQRDGKERRGGRREAGIDLMLDIPKLPEDLVCKLEDHPFALSGSGERVAHATWLSTCGFGAGAQTAGSIC
jgi:hypothetical protein